MRSALLARGVPSIDLRPPFPVGFATVGDELIDLGAPAGDAHRADLVALAIEDSLKSLRLVPLPFGILTDSPDDIRDISYRARERRVEVLILAGGLGDGVTDRVMESLRHLEAEIVLEGRTFGPGSGIFHAKVHDYDVIGISGMPLLAAAQLDLFVVPALLARLGAAPAYWDWSRVLWRLDAPATLHGARVGGGSPVGVEGGFTVLPCHVVTARGGPPALVARVPESPFLPVAAGEEGWAVIPSGPPGEPASERKAYFQPCRA
jgi:molybdopterin biosynthesis enzyme